MAALANQIAVVTGATSGIGAAIAAALARQAGTLCILGRQQARLDAAAAGWAAEPAKVETYPLRPGNRERRQARVR